MFNRENPYNLGAGISDVKYYKCNEGGIRWLDLRYFKVFSKKLLMRK